MQTNTHLDIKTALCGKVTRLEIGYAEVLLYTTHQMSADKQGLVHGGFVFGAADYAAMVTVNDPYVVLGSSTSTFIAPVKVGDAVLCKATLVDVKGKKRLVEVQAFVSQNLVYEGVFTAFVLDKHVLEN